MPRILGLNLVALIVATLAFYAVGAVWYGALFSELWTGLWGFTDAQMTAAEASAGPAMAMGFAITLVTTAFLGLALKALKADGLASAVKWAVFLWAGFVVTTIAYDIAYAMQPMMLLVLDGAHTLIGFVVAAAILTAMDGVAVKD
ncbi:DUF1761 domain-containing protein [Maricaulis sp.]|uniref:DUF1761 domain-containing protein n=1 Tax=Maricaulis sp. TaxID=1486257 RepID=UPI003299E6EB